MIRKPHALAVAMVCGLQLLGPMAAGAVRAAAIVPYQSCFARSAVDHAVAEELLIAVSAIESNWNVMARSSANAHGLMQIQWPGTARHLGVRRVSDLYKPCTNIDLGARYLRELLDRFDDDQRRALAAYNYGPSRIERSRELPAGAIRYAERVQAKRQALGRRRAGAQPARTSPAGLTRGASVGSAAAPLAPPPESTVLEMRSQLTAMRFLRVLKARVTGADFSYTRLQGGRHGIRMAVGANGLSARDRLVLKTLGWII